MESGEQVLARKKAALRAAMKERLAAVPAERFDLGGQRAAEYLRGTSAWEAAGTVLLYLSMDREARCDDLIRSALGNGKAVYLPRVLGSDLAFFRAVSLEGPWDRGPFGIREPIPEGPGLLRIGKLQGPLLAVLPGLAFDGKGGRLGRGKGYYDRFLARLGGKPLRVGFCIREQVVHSIPMDETDCPMDALVCDSGLSYARPGLSGL